MIRYDTPRTYSNSNVDRTSATRCHPIGRKGWWVGWSVFLSLGRVAAGLLLAGGLAWSQGQVVLQNLSLPSLDAPVYDTDGLTPLEGPAFLAALYAGPDAGALAAVGPAVPFRSEPAAGYFDLSDDPSNGVRAIPTVAPGTLAHVQVRAWEADYGATYEEALAADGRAGASEVFQVITGGGGIPPVPPAFLSGLTSFALVGPAMEGGGAVLLDNAVGGAGLDAPVFDVNGVTRLAGGGYSAMLYAGPNPLSLAPVGAAVPFQTGSGAGYFDLGADPEGGVRIVPTVAPGDPVYLQVRVWETARGASYEEAGGANSKRGISNLFSVWAGELATPALLLGLDSFHLVIRGGGTVYFMNLSPAQGVNAPVYDTDGATLLAGPDYLALLDAGPDAASLQPVGDPVPFRSGSGAGYFDLSGDTQGGVRIIPTVAPGTTAFLRVRVWESTRGATYEEALASGGKTGVSAVFSLVTGGGGDPPSLPPSLKGLQSFILVADIPFISLIPDQVIFAYQSTPALPFLISDLGTEANELELTLTTSNPGLVPAASIVLGGAGNQRTVTVTPVPGAFGDARITIQVRDHDDNSSITRFNLRVLRASWTLELAMVPLGAGSATGAGSYYDGTEAAIQATPQAGYRFGGWIGGGVADPQAASTTVSMTEARTVTATFIKTWSLGLVGDPVAGGMVVGAGIYDDGTEAGIQATPQAGYRFGGWIGGGVADPQAASTTVSMTEARTVTATFIKTWSLGLVGDPVAGGIVVGGGTYDDGTQAAVQATPQAGYRFGGWIGGGVADPQAASTTVSMTEARSVTATFIKTWSLGLVGDPEAAGMVTGAGTYDDGNAAVITAIAAKGYAFVGWDGEGIAAPGLSTTTVLMTGDRTATARFVSSEISYVRNTENNTLTLLWAGGYGLVLEESAEVSGESGPFVRVETADGEHTSVIDDEVMRRFRLRLPEP